MAGGLLYQATKGRRADTFIAKKKSVKWGKMSKVSPAVKSYVKKVVAQNEETKYVDSYSVVTGSTYAPVSLAPISASSPTAGAKIFPLNNFGSTKLFDGYGLFAQGTDNNSRVGDEVMCTSIAVHGKISMIPTDCTNRQVEVMVIRELQASDRANLTTSISDLTVLHTENDNLGFLKMDSIAALKNLQIVKHKKYVMDDSYGNQKFFNLKIKVNKKFTYDDEYGLTYENRYWLVAWCSDGNETSPTIQIQSRMYFKDA